MEQPPDGILKWHFSFDNPTPLGWTVVAVYVASAACCGVAAVKSRDVSGCLFGHVWWLLAGGLMFLGINKQLNLQTLMIVIGRNVSAAGDWYGARRKVQLIFSAVFAAILLGALGWFWRQNRKFFEDNPMVLGGAIVLALFVVLRASTISHVDALLRINLRDKDWAWLLEIAGSALIGAGALRCRGRQIIR